MAIKCIFLGLSTGKKAYKVHDLGNQRALISRDVVFHEKIFPYKFNNHEDSYIPLLVIANDTDEET